jgi:hypothetical protein
MRLAFLLPGLLVLLVSACTSSPQVTQPPASTTAPTSMPSPNAPTTQPTSPSKATPASVLPDDPRAAVEYALRAQPKAFPFKVTTTSTGGSSQMDTTIEVESPQRIMMVSATNTVKLVDGKCFEQNSDGTWQDCSNPQAGASATASASSLLDESIVNAAISMIKTVKLIGTETLNGIPARIYEYTMSGDQLGVQVDSTTRLWVSEVNGLPIKNETNSTAGGYSASFTQVITYDKSIKVQAP